MVPISLPIYQLLLNSDFGGFIAPSLNKEMLHPSNGACSNVVNSVQFDASNVAKGHQSNGLGPFEF